MNAEQQEINTINAHAQFLVSKGYTVYSCGKNWLYFGKRNLVGTCQFSKLNGLEYTTVHKPCRRYGTGFRADNLEEALSHVPSWMPNYCTDSVVKYKDLEHAISSMHNSQNYYKVAKLGINNE